MFSLAGAALWGCYFISGVFEHARNLSQLGADRWSTRSFLQTLKRARRSRTLWFDVDTPGEPGRTNARGHGDDGHVDVDDDDDDDDDDGGGAMVVV